MTVRLALLTEIPAPYRIPLFNALASQDGIELRVLFLAERDPTHPYEPRLDEFTCDRRVLPGRQLLRGGRWAVLSRGVLRELAGFRPHVVAVGGWNQPAFWQALLWTRLRRRPLVTWVESTARDARPGSAPLELAKRTFIRASAGFVVPGTASAEYLRSLGVGPERIAVAPNAVDQTIFGQRVRAARGQAEKSRPLFLYVGRLDHEKGVDVLLRAAADVPADLVVIGGGSEEERLREAAPENVRFLGRLEQDELVAWYAAADAFVLPSRSDQWGMVLNEAAAAGLPLVATEAPGAAHDLIEDGVNGFRVPVEDEHALADALRRLARDPGFRAAAGARSLELSRRFTPEAWAAAVAGLARRLVR